MFIPYGSFLGRGVRRRGGKEERGGARHLPLGWKPTTAERLGSPGEDEGRTGLKASTQWARVMMRNGVERKQPFFSGRLIMLIEALFQYVSRLRVWCLTDVVSQCIVKLALSIEGIKPHPIERDRHNSLPHPHRRLDFSPRRIPRHPPSNPLPDIRY